MTKTFKATHPAFETNDQGMIRVVEGEFDGTIYLYNDIGVDETGTLKYNAEIQTLMLDGEDVTVSHTHRNEAKFLNTIATPILTVIIEGLQQIEQEASKVEATPEVDG